MWKPAIAQDGSASIASLNPMRIGAKPASAELPEYASVLLPATVSASISRGVKR